MSENTMPENTAPEAGTPEVQSPDAGTPEIQTPDQHQMRRKMKLRARKVVKGHYALLVLLCLIAIFFGTEFTSIKTQNDNFHKLITGQEIDVGGSSFKAGGGSSHAEVFNDILENDVDAGKEQADKTTEEYKKTKLTGNILGRRKGLLAPIVNTYTSGHLYLTVVSAINNATKSQTAAVTLFIILSMLISAFIWIVVKNMIGAVLRRAFLEARLYSEVPTGHLMHFKTVKRWMRTARTLFVTDLFLALWRLTIVGAFIKHYSYFLVPYIVAENPDIRTLEAITLSRRMMDGHKWECFKLEMSFLGWFLLGSLTFGLSEVFWSLPYRVATCTEYYTKMRELAQEKEIELSEKLNDYYLYNRAEEAFLRECYPDIEEQKHYIDEHRITLTGAHGFLVKNFGLWIGHTAEKEEYEKLDSIRAQIAEERAAIKGRVYPMRLNPLMDAAKTLSLRALQLHPLVDGPGVLHVFTCRLALGSRYPPGRGRHLCQPRLPARPVAADLRRRSGDDPDRAEQIQEEAAARDRSDHRPLRNRGILYVVFPGTVIRNALVGLLGIFPESEREDLRGRPDGLRSGRFSRRLPGHASL